MTPPQRTNPPGLDALAEAVARYQAQQALQDRKTRTTKEVAVRVGKAASGPALAVAVAVALSQLAQGIWGGTSEPATAPVDARAAHAASILEAHTSELEALRKEAAFCRASIERLDLRLAVEDVPIKERSRKARKAGPE